MPDIKTCHHFSLDIETLSVNKNAVVTSIGAVEFFPDGGIGDSFHEAMDAQVQIDNGRHVSISTLKFWAGEDQDIYRETLRGTRHPVHVIQQFRDWLDFQAPDNELLVWVKGPHFDGAIIESLCEDFDIRCPVSYRQWQDVRTIENAAGYDEKAHVGSPDHNPLSDSIIQAAAVTDCLRRLGAW